MKRCRVRLTTTDIHRQPDIGVGKAISRSFVLATMAISLMGAPAAAQSSAPGGMPPPNGMSLAASNAMRFPQPVRVGDLLNRDVLQPVESQNVIGIVTQVVADKQGTIYIVIRCGGFLGFDTRQIAVPVNAMVLVGDVMEVVAFTPKDLRGFPNFSNQGVTPVPSDSIIKVGLAKPSH